MRSKPTTRRWLLHYAFACYRLTHVSGQKHRFPYCWHAIWSCWLSGWDRGSRQDTSELPRAYTHTHTHTHGQRLWICSPTVMNPGHMFSPVSFFILHIFTCEITRNNERTITWAIWPFKKQNRDEYYSLCSLLKLSVFGFVPIGPSVKPLVVKVPTRGAHI